MTHDIDPTQYTRVVVAFSGGKDSLASVLHLLELGVDRRRIELHHHDVDGGGGDFMDWPITLAYCRAVADYLQLPLYVSGRRGGFEREMMRDGDATAPVYFETPDDGVQEAGGKGPPGTRLRFPQVAADLRVRWCSAYLKIDVMAALLRNQKRFEAGRTLVVTGERAEESASRAKYQTFEPHRAHTQSRWIDHWRPIHAWPERDVWKIMQRHGINPHPAYRLGWGRLSCMACIFGSANQWATIRYIAPDFFARLADREESLGVTVKRGHTLRQTADRGTVYAAAMDLPWLAEMAMQREWRGAVHCDPQQWEMPAGAFGESAGPT